MSKYLNGQKIVDAVFEAGAVGAPSIRFANSPLDGFYRIGTNNVGLALNGAKVADLSTNGQYITGNLGCSKLKNNYVYVDSSRTDIYTADGSQLLPYKTILAALTVINADTGKNWIIKVNTGTYADNLTITNPRFLRIEGNGVTISGTILINSGVGSYDRIEFAGVRGYRAEKGAAMTISGKITAERTNDSLIYVGFDGCNVSGAFEATTSGTWVLHYHNCRVDGAITGTLAVNTQLDNTILIETYGFNEFAGAITGIVSFYNCHDSDFYGAINTTPWYENRFHHCSFASSVSVIPQVGASSALIYLDGVSYKSFKARTPTITGATYSHIDGGVMIGATTEILVGGGDGTNPVWTTATGTGAPVRATNPTLAGFTSNGRELGKQGADVASATNLALGTDGNCFEITGTTKIDLLSNVGWQNGSVITLFANENVTIDHATATSGTNVTILLAGAGDYNMTANDSLTLCLSETTAGGQAWREIARTAI
ncbi:MAG: hypothetical protein WC332_02750 [Clostridia bacterium]|jgi:hypothetical protein